MTTTRTSTAFTVVPKDMPSGTLARQARYTYSGATITASANALQIHLLTIPTGASIVQLQEQHSCGAASCPADFGLEVTAGETSFSALMSQVTQGQSNFMSPLKLPYLISCPDTQVTQYAKLIAGFTPGTATSAIGVAVNLLYTMDSV